MLLQSFAQVSRSVVLNAHSLAAVAHRDLGALLSGDALTFRGRQFDLTCWQQRQAFSTAFDMLWASKPRLRDDDWARLAKSMQRGGSPHFDVATVVVDGMLHTDGLCELVDGYPHEASLQALADRTVLANYAAYRRICGCEAPDHLVHANARYAFHARP